MFRSLLVPLDRSSLAEQALPWAFAVARRADARLNLVEVHGLYGMDEPNSRRAPFNPKEDEEYRGKEQLYLDATAKWLSAAGPISVRTQLLAGSVALSETVAESVLEEASAAATDLIVIASHTRGPFGRFVFGSVAQELVRRSYVPVLLVRPNDSPPQLIPEPDLKSILIPLDGSALAEQILEPALNLARVMAAPCTILQVVESGTQPCGQASETMQPEEYLECIASKIRTAGLQVRTQVVVAASAADAIGAEVNGQPNTLIALATHGRGGFKKLMVGSVAERLLHNLPTPMLVYRPSHF